MLEMDPSASVTVAGFSTGVEPCATALSMSSGGRALGTLMPGVFVLAAATGVNRALSPGWSAACGVVSAASPAPTVSIDAGELLAFPHPALATATSDRAERYRIC